MNDNKILNENVIVHPPPLLCLKYINISSFKLIFIGMLRMFLVTAFTIEAKNATMLQLLFVISISMKERPERGTPVGRVSDCSSGGPSSTPG